MNVENIKKVRDVIAGLSPERFDMETWTSGNGTTDFIPDGPQDLLHNCGTCGCIGGWTNAIFGSQYRSGSLARDALGLDGERGHDLFYPNAGSSGWSAKPAQAVAVLDHLIATGEVDWTVADQVSA